jgi:hypothetical protein
MAKRIGLSISCLIGAAVVASASSAQAQSIIKNPGDHPDYHVELEPHGLVAPWQSLYGTTGWGLGFRASIPIVSNGFIPSVNNNVAISFGLDWSRYSGCYGYYYRGLYRSGYGCGGASYFMFPVAMQWNFWLTPKWSVFGEPGLFIYHAVFDDYCVGVVGCSYPTRTGVHPLFHAGARFHFNDTVALTMRIGYPYISIGVSFML